MRKQAFLALLLMTLGFLMPSTVLAKEATGTIIINLQDSSNADVPDEAWTLHRGTDATGTVVESSTGDATLNYMALGSYFLETTSNTGSYKAIAISSTNPQTVTADGTIKFNVLYTLQPTTGTIVVNLQDSVGAEVFVETWNLYYGTSASGYLVHSGTGDAVISNRTPGSYFFETTSNIGSYQTVEVTSANTQTLSAGNTVTFSGLYTLKPQTGTVVIDLKNNTGLDTAGEAWKLHSGINVTGTVVKIGGGNASIPNLPVGSYFLETTTNNGLYESVKITPANPQTLTTGGTVTFKVVYGIDSTITSSKGKIARIFAKRRREIFQQFHTEQKACKLTPDGERADCYKANTAKKKLLLKAVQAEKQTAMKAAEVNDGENK